MEEIVSHRIRKFNRSDRAALLLNTIVFTYTVLAFIFPIFSFQVTGSYIDFDSNNEIVAFENTVLRINALGVSLGDKAISPINTYLLLLAVITMVGSLCGIIFVYLNSQTRANSYLTAKLILRFASYAARIAFFAFLGLIYINVVNILNYYIEPLTYDISFGTGHISVENIEMFLLMDDLLGYTSFVVGGLIFAMTNANSVLADFATFANNSYQKGVKPLIHQLLSLSTDLLFIIGFLIGISQAIFPIKISNIEGAGLDTLNIYTMYAWASLLNPDYPTIITFGFIIILIVAPVALFGKLLYLTYVKLIQKEDREVSGYPELILMLATFAMYIYRFVAFLCLYLFVLYYQQLAGYVDESLYYYYIWIDPSIPVFVYLGAIGLTLLGLILRSLLVKTQNSV